MNWFSNLKIKAKLIAAFVVLAIFTGVVGVIGINSMSQINKRGDEMYYNSFIPAQNLAGIQRDLIEVRATYLLMLYERDATKLQDRIDLIAGFVERTNTILNEYDKAIITKEDRELFDIVKTSLVTYRDVRNTHIEMVKEGKFDEAESRISEFTGARQVLETSLSNLIEYNKNHAKESAEINTVEYENQSTIMLIVIASGILLSIGMGLMISSIIGKPLNQLVEAANKIADGDLDVVVTHDTKDEVGALALAFRKMTDNLNEVMSNINTAAEQVASGSRQVSDSSMALSQGATEQASSVEQLTASLEEISSQTKQNADNANQANSLAEVTKGNAIHGNGQMQDMLRAMDEINDSSNNISKIIKVIDEIAFQTNILALNAAVEAARAGQHGKGFAVVAEEVRNLAARSANAAKETTEMIEGSIKKVEDGTKFANQTAEALNKIVDDITRVASLVGDIAVASNEQALGIAQVNQGIMQVSEVVQTNSATSEESAAASEELSSQAELLKDQISRFNLRRRLHKNTNYYNEEMNPEVLKMLDKMSSKNTKSISEFKKEAAATKTKKIILSDQEFGKY